MDEGLRTWKALELATWDAPIAHDGGFEAVNTFPGGLSYYDPSVTARGRRGPRGVRPLIDRAIAGDWHATGRRKIGDGRRPSKPDVISPDTWEYLILDVDTDSASGGGLELVGLRWHLCPPPEREKKTIVAKKECIGWLFEIMKHPRTTTVPQLQSEAQHKFPNLSARTFRRALSEVKGKNTIHPSWRKSGPLSS